MAVSITQEPTQMNTAYTKLMYAVVSSNIDLPQYKYVCDVLDYNDNLISRLKQPANEQLYGIFNVAVPCRGKLEEDTTLYLQDPTASIGKDSPADIKSYKQFKVKFGEEYGTSPSSSVTIYDGNGSAGNPAVSGSDLVLNRAVWEPWNEQQFISSSQPPTYENSGTGSFNFFVYEATGSDFVDVNLRVNGAYPTGGFGGSGSFSWSGSNGLYDLDVISFGVSSSAHRYSLEIYDMSNQQMVFESGYVTGSVGGPQTIISNSFTGSQGVLYGCRVNGIPTSSFNPPSFNAYYNVSDYTASSDLVNSGAYPLFPTNVINVSNFLNTEAYEVTSNGTAGAVIGQALEAYPTLADFSLGEIPFIPPLPAGNFGSWNWNYQDSRINWTGSNQAPTLGGDKEIKLYLTNWPQIVSSPGPTDYIIQNGSRKVSQNDLMTTSWYNISGSVEQRDNYAIRVSLTNDAGVPTQNKNWTDADLDALTPLIRQTGSNADIPFVTCPIGPASIPTLWPSTGSSDWTRIRVNAHGRGIGDAEMFFIREEPCAWQTRTNFAFINKWGVWDFIGLNTPTNKNAVINERNEYMSVNTDYNSQISSYNAYNRGFEQYYMNQNYRYKITTDPIPLALPNNMIGGYTAVADFYQELFTSPSVYIQQEYKFIPINITNSNFRWKTNIKAQKVYQVDIEYEFSNKPRSRT